MAKISEFITSIIAKVDNYYCLNKSLDYNLIISTLKSLENHLVNNSVEFNTDNLSDRDMMSKLLDHHNIPYGTPLCIFDIIDNALDKNSN